MTPSAQTAGGRRVTRWTRETIIEKIGEWNDRYGEPPCSADWNPSLARWRAQEWRIERYRDGVWPSTNAVKRPFGGSFDAAVRAAGLTPRRPGPRPRAVAEVAAPDGAAAERRAQRAEAKLDAARRRARRASEQAGRARRALARAHEAQAEWRDRVVEEAARAIEEADARVRAASDQAEAAVRDAASDRARARESEARGPAGARRSLGAGELARLRDGGPSGPAVLAAALRSLAVARASGDRAGLARALGDVASAAVRWRDAV